MINIHGYTDPKEVRIKEGWEDVGKRGLCHGYINLDQCWAIVVWNDSEDPELVKMRSLEEKFIVWRPIT